MSLSHKRTSKWDIPFEQLALTFSGISPTLLPLPNPPPESEKLLAGHPEEGTIGALGAA